MKPIQAMAFAEKALAGAEPDKNGQPAIEHAKAVAAACAQYGQSPEHICVAWLHDVIEDTPETNWTLGGGQRPKTDGDGRDKHAGRERPSGRSRRPCG